MFENSLTCGVFRSDVIHWSYVSVKKNSFFGTRYANSGAVQSGRQWPALSLTERSVLSLLRTLFSFHERTSAFAAKSNRVSRF